jgi:intracellular protein transport protein USO1
MLRLAQPPAKQTATETINTLCSRLQSATLLEDRRAAILGLRSFAKLYPASVASGALRHLIAGLSEDGEDPDTIKSLLETLLMLFEPDQNSLEASEDIKLWLADEFTQRQENVTPLLDLLESREFYLRLYSLQILSHISAARPERTQECIFTAPLGVSRLVAVLDDRREAVRNEALLLLVALTPSSTELQKVVAFENAFDRIFSLIEAEGSLTHGSTTVQDCLSLLANLLKLNVSNQSYFREIGCIARLAKLLQDVVKEENSEDGISEWMKPQRDMNVWGVLTVIQLFLVRGGLGTPLNQNAFWQNGVLLQVLSMAFHADMSVSIRAKSLNTCADLIRGNEAIQEQFGDLAVPKPRQERSLTNGHASGTTTPKAALVVNGEKEPAELSNVIEVLLQLILEPASVSLFDVRLAACNCMKAFFADHSGIRIHVLRRAIQGYKDGADEIPNILNVLFEPPTARSSSDSYQVWMASVLLLHLLYENAEAKAMALAVSEGDTESGEEVITMVQGITANIVADIQRVEDERALIGYLMTLCVWLFEEPDAVNDLLSEGSNVQSLIQAVKISSQRLPLVAGLCSLLLGIIYEFSSKDSPVPRKTLHDLLVSSLGREVYIDRLTKLRESVYVRDFEVMGQGSNVDGGLPDVYFDKTFIDFLKDNFSRLLRAIDRDPGLEVSIMTNGVQKGISRELVDSLRAQLDERTKTLQALESELVGLRRKLEQEELDHRRTRDSSTVEVGRIKQINESLQRHHDEELRQLTEESANIRKVLVSQHQHQLQDTDQRAKQSLLEAENRAARVRERNEGEVAELKNTVAEVQARLTKTEKNHVQDLQTAHEEYVAEKRTLEARLRRAEEKVEEAEERTATISKELVEVKSASAKLKSELEEKETARQEVQSELDDLLVVFGDLETKRKSEKAALKALGADVSEDEDEEEEDEGDDDDDEEPGENDVD